MRKLNRVIIHHTCSPRDTTTANQIAQWHRERGLGDGIQYHYVIFGDGKTINPLKVANVGNAAWGWNEDSVHVCLTGNFDKEKPSNAQLWALKRLLAVIQRVHYIAIKWVYCHGEIAKPGHGTACPGINLTSFVHKLKGDSTWLRTLILKLFPNSQQSKM